MREILIIITDRLLFLPVFIAIGTYGLFRGLVACIFSIFCLFVGDTQWQVMWLADKSFVQPRCNFLFFDEALAY
jgi:hypothetical protein